MADGQNPVGLIRHLDHLLALRDVPGHELFAQDMLSRSHGVDGDRRVQVQRQSDDDHLDVLVFQELVIVVVHLDFLASFLAVNALEAFARRVGLADEDALAIGRTKVAAGDEFQILGVMFANEDAAFVAGADEAGFDGTAMQRLVAVISRDRDWQDRPGG